MGKYKIYLSLLISFLTTNIGYSSTRAPSEGVIENVLWKTLLHTYLKDLEKSYYQGTNLLFSGTEAIESEEIEKNSFIKTVSIYSLEWLGAAVVTVPYSFLSMAAVFGPPAPVCPPPQKTGTYADFARVYIVGNTLLGSLTTWGIGKLLKQRGSLWKSMIGAGIGSAIGVLGFWTARNPGIGQWGIVLFLAAPATGAVIGYNLGR
jgi:hypothetical protein